MSTAADLERYRLRALVAGMASAGLLASPKSIGLSVAKVVSGADEIAAAVLEALGDSPEPPPQERLRALREAATLTCGCWQAREHGHQKHADGSWCPARHIWNLILDEFGAEEVHP